MSKKSEYHGQGKTLIIKPYENYIPRESKYFMGENNGS